jgi:hypothetical protein
LQTVGAGLSLHRPAVILFSDCSKQTSRAPPIAVRKKFDDQLRRAVSQIRRARDCLGLETRAGPNRVLEVAGLNRSQSGGMLGANDNDNGY